MTSFADLFNPTFFMFLGILLLIVAVLVLYFESKMRDQNHKIASMLSLVSTLAEDMNGVKMGLNHLAIRGGYKPDIHLRENLGNNFENKLIEVSDDEDSDNDNGETDNGETDNGETDNGETDNGETDNGETDNGEADNEDSDNEDSDNEESDNEDSDNKESDNEDSDNKESDNEDSYNKESDNEEIKVIKLQVSNEDLIEDDDSYEEANNLEFEIDDKFKTDDNNFQEVLEDILNFPNCEIEKNIPSSSDLSSDLKKISINLGEVREENIDYKKLQLPKLRSIVVEKGLINNSESIKLKKPELLKLLGVLE
jgi:hypothetical protein